MKKIFIYIVLFCSTVAVAQQIPLYSQYWTNPMLINPGFTGSTDNIEANVIHRNQWKNIPGAPVTSVLSLDGATNDDKVGLGLILSDDKAGIFAKRSIYTSYSYKIKLAEGHYLRPGINVGLQDVMVDFSRSNIQDKNDPYLFNTNRRKSSFDANFGVAYFWKDLKAGVSVLQLVPHKYRLDTDTGSYYKSNSKVNIYVTYLVPLSKDAKINFNPVIAMNMGPRTPFQFDVLANFDYDELVYAGLGYRFNTGMCFNLGIKWNKSLRVSYNYDLVMGKLSGYTGGSHELSLGYSFGKSSGEEKPKEFFNDNANATNDSLKTEVANLKKEVNILKAEMEVQKSGNIASTVKEDLVIQYAKDYKNLDGTVPTPGFYIIMAQFHGLPEAEADVKELVYSKFDAKMISHPSKGYYIYEKFLTDKKAAEEELKAVRWKRLDSYILELK